MTSLLYAQGYADGWKEAVLALQDLLLAELLTPTEATGVALEHLHVALLPWANAPFMDPPELERTSLIVVPYEGEP